MVNGLDNSSHNYWALDISYCFVAKLVLRVLEISAIASKLALVPLEYKTIRILFFLDIIVMLCDGVERRHHPLVETLKRMKQVFAYQILVAMPILYLFSSIHLLGVSSI
jgi:hypothetical protein